MYKKSDNHKNNWNKKPYIPEGPEIPRSYLVETEAGGIIFKTYKPSEVRKNARDLKKKNHWKSLFLVGMRGKRRKKSDDPGKIVIPRDRNYNAYFLYGRPGNEWR